MTALDGKESSASAQWRDRARNAVARERGVELDGRRGRRRRLTGVELWSWIELRCSSSSWSVGRVVLEFDFALERVVGSLGMEEERSTEREERPGEWKSRESEVR